MGTLDEGEGEGALGVKVVLLDIEGTICPISFVKDVLFPYASSALPHILTTEWSLPSFTPYRDAFPLEYRTDPTALLSHYLDLSSRDIKAPYLKSLQGYLWRRGYESGELRCTLFSDVRPALERWCKAGVQIMIYSSGSVEAQKLLLRYTNEKPEADLRYLVTAWWDTVNAGPKQEVGSYERILKGGGAEGEAGKWLFLSDNVKEVEAAKEAGMDAFVVVREGNMPLSQGEKEGNVLVGRFEEVSIKVC